MFNLFKKDQPSQPVWLPELQETRERWFTFLDKLEDKMEELCTAAIPELRDLLVNDDDMYKRTFLKVQAGVKGQLDHIRKKAADTFDEKVNNVFYRVEAATSVLDGNYSLLHDFRTACSDRYHHTFEEKWQLWYERLNETAVQDREGEYRAILTDFQNNQDKFSCKQCGSPIRIEKIFLISTYITCPHCQTQNTFEPGTQARNLQNIARELAEQRTVHLYKAYQQEEALERELYHKNHELKLSIIHEKDRAKLKQVEQTMAENESRRQESIRNAPQLHVQYLRAMYDEWNSITPDLKEHNEKMYLNQIAHIHRSV